MKYVDACQIARLICFEYRLRSSAMILKYGDQNFIQYNFVLIDMWFPGRVSFVKKV